MDFASKYRARKESLVVGGIGFTGSNLVCSLLPCSAEFAETIKMVLKP